MPLPQSHSSGKLAVVYTTRILEEAHIIIGRLHSEDIPAMIQRESAAGAIGITFGHFGLIEVLVNEADYAEAMALLHADEPASLPVDRADVYLDSDTLPDDEDDN